MILPTCPNVLQSKIQSSKIEGAQDCNPAKWLKEQLSATVANLIEINRQKTRLILSKSFSSYKKFKNFNPIKLALAI
jgi:hypothetical protein